MGATGIDWSLLVVSKHVETC